MGKISLIRKVRKYISRHRMARSGDRILAAVSGGPDSIALLHILYLLKEELGISLHVAHLNHMFRGEVSEGDAFFVAEQARGYGLPCTLESVDVPSYGRKHRLSNQAAAREVRYKFLLACAGRINASKIALGHQADDQAETILINFLRGAGPGGLKGILPVRDGTFIRPLLNVRRAEIENFCGEMGLAFRQDASNLKPVYTRNKIRLNLTPLLEKNYNPELVPALVRLGEICRAEDDCLQQLAEESFRQALLAVDTGHISLDLERLSRTPLALRRRVLRHAWQSVSGARTGLDFQHVEAALSLIDNNTTGAQAVMPGHVIAVRNYSCLELKLQPAQDRELGPEWEPELYQLQIPGTTFIPEMDISIDACLRTPGPGCNPKTLPRDEALLDFEKLPNAIFVRRRRAGDVFHPYGRSTALKLKDFLIKQRVPRAARDRLPLICTPREIVWVGGVRTGEKWKVGGSTKRILHLKVIPGK